MPGMADGAGMSACAREMSAGGGGWHRVLRDSPKATRPNPSGPSCTTPIAVTDRDLDGLTALKA